jgi:hypothetical protein
MFKVCTRQYRAMYLPKCCWHLNYREKCDKVFLLESFCTVYRPACGRLQSSAKSIRPHEGTRTPEAQTILILLRPIFCILLVTHGQWPLVTQVKALIVFYKRLCFVIGRWMSKVKIQNVYSFRNCLIESLWYRCLIVHDHQITMSGHTRTNTSVNRKWPLLERLLFNLWIDICL